MSTATVFLVGCSGAVISLLSGDTAKGETESSLESWITVSIDIPAPDDFADDESYLRSVAERAQRLINEAEKSPDSLRKMEYYLAAANFSLAYELEPTCTRKTLGLPVSQSIDSEIRIRDVLARIADQLAKTRELVESRKVDNDDPRASALVEHERILSSFVLVMAAYLIPGNEPEASRIAREAASKMAVLLESSSPQLFSAASYWHAELRWREGDSSRTLSGLDLVLADPPRDSLPFSFFAKLLRCRILACAGGGPSAIALLNQMEVQCSAWLVSDRDAQDAGRTISLVEIQALGEWRKQSMGPFVDGQYEWFRRRADAKLRDRFQDSHRVYRLRPTVPILVDAPTVRERPAKQP